MSELLVLWAQALDNSSPDQIELRGERLPEHDSARRQEAVSTVSAVVRNGTRLYDEGGVRLTEDGGRFVLEVPTAQSDLAGRTAPVVCCGLGDPLQGEELVSATRTWMEDFCIRIGRTLLAEHVERVFPAFAVLKKKYLRRRLVRMAILGAATMATLALVAWLLSRVGL